MSEWIKKGSVMPYTRKALYYAIITTDVRNGKTHQANIKQETYVERIRNKRKLYDHVVQQSTAL